MDWTPPSDAVETKSKQDVTSTTKEGWTPPSDAVETKAAFGKYPKPGMEPGKATPTVSALGAFGASAVEGIAATPGVMAGARIGAGLMPPVAPVLGPLSKPAGALAGGILGGIAASKVIKTTEQFADIVFGTNISGVREQQEKEHPYASLFGQVAGGSFNPLMHPGLPSSISQGVTGSGIMTIVGATQRAIQGGDPFDPVAMTVDAAAGAFTKATKLGERMLGQAAAPIDMSAGKKPDVEWNKSKETPSSPGSTPEQQADFLKMVEIKAKAPLVETAFKNKKTGEVTRTGPKHPDNLKADDKLTQGFVDELGVFHTRDEAVAQAKRSGQIPEDHTLENPPNEEAGLHSGDLRKTGDKRFEVNAEQPAGVSTAKPEWEQLQEHTKGATNVGQAIDRILAVPNFGNNSQRSLLQTFNSSPFIKDADISFIQEHLVVDGKKAAGSYMGGEGKHEVTLAKDGNINTLIHEATHAGTQRLLQEGNHPAAKRLNDLFNEFKNREEPLYEAKLEAFKKEKGDKLTLKDLNTFRDQNTHYGLESVEEFVSETLSNDDFKKFLADTKSKGTGGVISNMLKNIRDAIYDGLGIEQKDRSALDDVLEHTSELLEASKDYTRDSNGKLSISPSKISQMVHDDLEKEGIAVAHTSPHKFGMFNWVKHALSGEGANVFGAGTYFSQKDSTNKYYIEMSKQKALDKYFESPEGKADKTRLDTLQYESFEADERVGELSTKIQQIEQHIEQLKDHLFPGNPHIEQTKREVQVLDIKKTQLENEYKLANEESDKKLGEYEQEKEQVTEKIKVPTYHSSIKASSEELLDWNSTQQSDLVKNAFENLGVKSVNSPDKVTETYINEVLEDRWYGNLEEDGETGVTIFGRDYIVKVNEITFKPDGTSQIDSLVIPYTGEIVTSFEQAKKSVLEIIYQDQGYAKKTGEQLYEELTIKFEPTDKATRNLITDREARQIGMAKASIALAEQGVVGNVHNAQGGTEQKFRNYVVFDDSRTTQNYVTLASRIKESISEPASKAVEKIDPRSIPNEEEFFKHAVNIHEAYGPEEAVKFFEEYKKNLNERTIPVPNNNAELDDAFHRINTYEIKDRSEHVVGYEQNTKNGVTEQQRAQWFDMRERGEELPPEAKAIFNELDAENIALVRKAKGMGLEVGDEFATGQSRIRLFSEKEKPGWKDTIKKFFSNDTPVGDKIADQANAAIERKVYQLEDGRVVEIHRQPNDIPVTKGRDIKKGTEIWEWKDGKKKLIGHTDNLEFKRGDKINIDGKETTMVDGKVDAIEQNSPYKYLHDAEASARLANMGLRKMVREAEFVENLKKSDLFKQVAHGPDEDPKTLPSHYIQPESIGNIPQLRGWSFDPKTAAIIQDFAKVWDNTMWMKMTNAVVKNMMLNPIPHMFNEVMHLWNARGFTGWVDPRRLGTFADTARVAWRDVGQQTQFYRDIMREGGSILGADPRNKGYFEAIQKEAQKQMFGDPQIEKSLGQLAKKLGVTVGNLYNSISSASQKAMWFTRDVMYVQYIREIMSRQEKSTGIKMELKDAVAEAEKHMPNYRMPSEVLGSRGIAKVLKNPNVAVFSRYHYGMVKSLINTLKDVDPRNLSTPEGRKHFREGVDSMVAIGVAMAALYPLMDKMAEAVFGEGAEQRRAGPMHLLQAGLDVYKGNKDASALIWPVFTFNPILLTLGQLALNKKIFTGKEIYHPDDSFKDIASDIGTYTAKQIPQVPPVMSAVSEEEGESKFLAKQLDIKAKSQKDLEREARAKKYQERVKKGRDTKRDKGTYTP